MIPRPAAGLTEAPPADAQLPVDLCTIGHLAVGFAIATSGVKLPGAMAIGVGWEIAEQPLKRKYPRAFSNARPDSTLHSVLDAMAVVAGWYLGRNMAARRGLSYPD